MSERGLVEARNGLAIWGSEGDVGARARRCCIGAELDCELVTAAGIAIANAPVVCEHADIAKRSKRSVIERGSACQIDHSDRQVVEHGYSGLTFEFTGVRRPSHATTGWAVDHSWTPILPNTVISPFSHRDRPQCRSPPD